MNIFLQTDAAQLENLIVPDSVQKARFTEMVRSLTNDDFIKNIWTDMANWLVWTGIKFIISLVIFYVGRWLLHKLLVLVDAIMQRREVEVSLHSFIMTVVLFVTGIVILKHLTVA